MSSANLVAYGYDSSSSDQSSSDDHDDQTLPKTASGSKNKVPLPLPNLDPGTTCKGLNDTKDRALKNDSVYFNPFLKQEERKFAILSKHVSLSSQQSGKAEKKKQGQMCRQFQKYGRCRFGEDCKFFHSKSTPIQQNSTASERARCIAGKVKIVTQTTQFDKFSKQICQEDQDADDDLLWEGGKKKEHRKRVGVTDSMIPPKMSMKVYQQYLPLP